MIFVETFVVDGYVHFFPLFIVEMVKIWDFLPLNFGGF